MKIYLVGGAIRDFLLNLPIKDKDWVVVGGTKEMLLEKNFQQVGKDFPVFLHPETHEEYALARQERKIGKGYTGFITCYNTTVTLENDLVRRDLTINAIAQDKYGNYIDPFNGQKDMQYRLLRHVSASFVEDPLRVLRTARFAASLAHLGFKISADTLLLMHTMVKKKELSYLTPDRIWKETEKALKTTSPHIYFQILNACQALQYVFPEIYYAYKKKELYHMTFQNYDVIFMGLAKISTLTNDISIRFSYLCQFLSHDYKKNIVAHEFYDQTAAIIVKNFCKRLNIPSYITEIAIISTGFYYFLNTIYHQSSRHIIMFFLKVDAWRKPERIEKLSFLSNFNACNIFSSNKLYLEKYSFLKTSFAVINNVSIKLILRRGFKGYAIKKELIRLRVEKLESWRSKNILCY